MNFSEAQEYDSSDGSYAILPTKSPSEAPSKENILEMAAESEEIRHGNLNSSRISSTPLNQSLQRIMDESCTDLNKDWSPVMQRLELLRSQLESNDEVIHEMERNLKAKTPNSEMEQPVDEVEYLKKTISSLEEKVANAETTIYNLEEEVEEKNKLIEARTMVISVLQKDVEAKRVATNSMFEKTQQEIQNMHENFMAFKENMAIENKKLLEQLDNSRQRYRKLDLKMKEAEKEKVNLIQMNNDLNFQIENIMALNNQLKMKVVELTENIDSPKQKIRELTDDLENMKLEFQKTVLNLELEIAHYKGECENVKKSFQEKQQVLEGEVAHLKKENNNLTSKISSFEAEIFSLGNGKKQKEATLSALVEEKEKLISEMKHTIEQLHSQQDELVSRLTQAQSSLETKEMSFAQVKAEVDELKSALDAIKLSGNNEEMACLLNNEINLLQDQLCQSKNELHQEKQRVQMLTETIDELEEKIQDSDLLLMEEKQNTINIKKELDHLKKQMAEKEEELAREKGSSTQLQENFYLMLNELEQYKQHFSQNSNETLGIQQKLESAEEEKERLETVISDLLRDVISMTAKSTETEINFEKENELYVILQEKFRELSATFIQITQDLKSKEDLIANLRAELDNLVKSKEEAIINMQVEHNNLLESKEDAIVNLQKELESLKQNEDDRVSVRDMEAYIAQQDEIIKGLRTNAQVKTEEAIRLATSCEELKQRLNEYAAYTASELENRDKMIGILQSSFENKSEAGDLSIELQTLQARVHYLEQTLMETNSNLESQISKLREVENENEALKSKISQALSDNEEKLVEKTKSLDQLSVQYNELLSKFNEISSYVTAADSELINKDHTIRNLETQIETVENEGGQKLQALNTLIGDKEGAYLKLKSDYDHVSNQLMEIQETLRSKVELCDNLQVKIDNLSLENAKLSNFETECIELLKQSEDLQMSKNQRHLEVEQELMQVTNVTKHLTDENNTLSNKVIELSDQIRHHELEKVALADELKILKESLRESVDKNGILKEEVCMSSGLETQVHDLERLIEEKDRLIAELQLKISANEKCVQKQEKVVESESTAKNSVSGSFESNDSGSLLPLAQEYLRINCQLMILKDLLEDLVNCEIGELNPESDLKSILESLESDLQESEVALKTYECKLRKSPGLGSDSLESSVSALSSYVDQITKQISTCGEILKDWVLIKTPPKKFTFNVEIQTDFSIESKATSRLNSENLDDWNWDVENNEVSEIKLDDNLLFQGSLEEKAQVQSEGPNKVLSEIKEVNVASSVDPSRESIALTPVNNLENAAVNPFIVKNETQLPEGSVVTTDLGENMFIKPQVSGYWVEGRWYDQQGEGIVMQQPQNQLGPGEHDNSVFAQSHEGHCHAHDHNHEHSHDSHDHDHKHDHQHMYGSNEENYRLVHVSYEDNQNLAESELPDHSHSEEENYDGGYLQENQLIVVNKAHVEDMKVKLDSVLYKLHEKDVQNNELTRELIELLKERDILQLKLSSAYRLLASQEKEPADTNRTSNSMKNEELTSKINELDSLSGWHDSMVKIEHEQKNMQALYSNQALPANLRPQKGNHTTETESDGAIYSLFNWITGSR